MNQHKRAKKSELKLKANLVRLIRDVERYLESNTALKPLFSALLDKVNRLLLQTKTSNDKLYSLHAPKVECIAKGKANKHYEFGVKVSTIATQANNFIVGTLALYEMPYDGHTLKPGLDQVGKLTGIRPKHCFVDNGYKGYDETEASVHIARKKKTYATKYLKKLMKQRNAIKVLFSHAKRDG